MSNVNVPAEFKHFSIFLGNQNNGREIKFRLLEMLEIKNTITKQTRPISAERSRAERITATITEEKKICQNGKT